MVIKVCSICAIYKKSPCLKKFFFLQSKALSAGPLHRLCVAGMTKRWKRRSCLSMRFTRYDFLLLCDLHSSASSKYFMCSFWQLQCLLRKTTGQKGSYPLEILISEMLLFNELLSLLLDSTGYCTRLLSLFPRAP